jgi:hypothetical protein
MPEGVDYGPQFTASTGLSLNYIGKHAYAHSGPVTVNNDSIECLNFTTGKDPMIATFYFTTDYNTLGDTKKAGFAIKLNGITIADQNQQYSTSYEAVMPNTIKFLIPPFTEVVTIGTTNSTNANLFYHTIVGKLYK